MTTPPDDPVDLNEVPAARRPPLAPVLILASAAATATGTAVFAGADIALGVFAIVADVGMELWSIYGTRRNGSGHHHHRGHDAGATAQEPRPCAGIDRPDAPM